MNSLDPWSVIATDPAGNVILPPARYGHPFYRDVPSWQTYGNQGDRRFLFEGAFVGAETPAAPVPPKRTGLTAAVAPVVAPATGGITVKKELDDKQILHVEICVDGKCYQQSMDLAPAIDMVLKKLASWHESQHATKAATLPADAVVGCVDAAVGQAADGIVDELIGCHCDTICGSFLGDIAGAVQGAVHGVVHGVGSIAGGIGSTLKKLKGPIAVAAAAAATAGAAAIPGVGPIAAPIAGKLAYSLVQSAAGDNKAKQQVQAAQQQAKTDPTIAVALAEAQKAVANATVAHHVQETAKQAASGHPAAQQQIAQVQADASQGDPAAQAVQAIIQNALSGLTSSASAPVTMAGQWFDMIGATPSAAAEQVRARGKQLASSRPGAAVGAIHAVHDGHWHVYSFSSLDDAIDWLQRAAYDKASFTYAAAYEKGNDGEAYIQAEEFGRPSSQHLAPGEVLRRGIATTSGRY